MFFFRPLWRNWVQWKWRRRYCWQLENNCWQLNNYCSPLANYCWQLAKYCWHYCWLFAIYSWTFIFSNTILPKVRIGKRLAENTHFSLKEVFFLFFFFSISFIYFQCRNDFHSFLVTSIDFHKLLLSNQCEISWKHKI